MKQANHNPSGFEVVSCIDFNKEKNQNNPNKTKTGLHVQYKTVNLFLLII